MYTRAVCLLLHDADREDQVAGTDVVDDVQPLDHPAEAGVAAVEVLRRLAGAADKKLRAAVSFPAWAIESTPRSWYWRGAEVSHLILYPGPPCPSPRGQPPWMTKPGITRWKVSPS